MTLRGWVRSATLVAFLVVPLAGCELALIGAVGGSAYTAFEDRRTAGTQLEDEGIELRVGNRIADRFGDRAHVSVNVFNRWVLITGEVPEESMRAEAEKIAQAVPNVRGVANEMQVAGVSSLASRASDSFITSKVKARMVDGRRVNPVHVKVVTEAGVVYLMGILTDRESNDAVEIARTTSGVRKVVKIFEACRTTDEVCRPRQPSADQPAKPAGRPVS
jgi:osmotically-inducible protein OsmY